MRRASVLLCLIVFGCSGETRFKPNTKAMIVNPDRDYVMATAKGEGSGLLPDSIAIPKGTTVLIESDDGEPFTFKSSEDDMQRTYRNVAVLIIDGEFKGIQTKVDFTNLRPIPE